MDNARLAKLIADLHNVVDGLDCMFAECDRRFTPDGHLVGSIGEAVAMNIYGLKLEQSSKEGWDALSTDGRTVQIKTTSTRSIALKKAAQYAQSLLVLKLDRGRGFSEIYAGAMPTHLLKEPDGRGYHSIPISALLAQDVHAFHQQETLDDLNRHFLHERSK